MHLWAVNPSPCAPSPSPSPQIKECKRLLRPGGTLALADNNPRSKVIQNLPPVLFTLMKRWGGCWGRLRRGWGRLPCGP